MRNESVFFGNIEVDISADVADAMLAELCCKRVEAFEQRVGIGAKPPQWDLADYVLAPFSAGDRELVDGAIQDAADAVRLIVSGETDRAMNLYNTEKTV